MKLMIRYLVGIVALSAFTSVFAEPCLDNFTADGGLLAGKTYKTWAVLPGVRPQDAFVRAYAFTAENGFTVLSSDKEAGVISATQSISYGKGKTVPLTLTIRGEGDGTRISISYATSVGLISPEDAIKRHFCMTMSAAADQSKGTAGAATTVGVGSDQARSASPQRPTAPRGYAELSPEQHQAISKELNKVAPTPQIRQLVQEASPAIAAFVERVSCLADLSGASALNEFAAPGASLNTLFFTGTMHNTQYHNKATCMTVSRVQGWFAPAANALRFEVLYKADDSGETVKMTHETVRQPDGTWLFTH